MSSFNPNSNPESPVGTQLPAELVAIAAELDRLGVADRAATPAGLEARVFDASREAFVHGDSPVVYSFASRSQWTTRLFRIAAMVAVVGGVGLAWWATRPPVLPVDSGQRPDGGSIVIDEPERDLVTPAEDEFFAVLTSGGDTLGSEIESLHSEAQRVYDSISAPSPSSWNEQPSGGLGVIDSGAGL